MKESAFGTQFEVGTAQVETATVVGTITGSGNATVVTTAAGMTGSPITTSVAVLDNDTADSVANKIRIQLSAVSNITTVFDVGGSGACVVLTRLLAAANDATTNVSIDNGTCTGLTTAAVSANTKSGIAYENIAQVSNISGPGLSLDTEDVTTHDSPGGWEEVVGTILRSGEVSLDLAYDPNDATHDASSGVIARLVGKTGSLFSIIFPGPYTWRFGGLVTGFEPSAPVDGALTGTAKIKISGQPELV